MFVTIEQNINFKLNIQKNRLKIKELLERIMGEKKKQNRLIPTQGLYYTTLIINSLGGRHNGTQTNTYTYTYMQTKMISRNQVHAALGYVHLL